MYETRFGGPGLVGVTQRWLLAITKRPPKKDLLGAWNQAKVQKCRPSQMNHYADFSNSDKSNSSKFLTSASSQASQFYKHMIKKLRIQILTKHSLCAGFTLAEIWSRISRAPNGTT